MNKKAITTITVMAVFALACGTTEEVNNSKESELSNVEEVSQELGYPASDEKGNGNLMGYATRLRCAIHLALPNAKVYELGHEYSETMPASPFGDSAINVGYKATAGIPYSSHAGNGETGGAVGSQGTQFDALGHFGYLSSPWFGQGAFPASDVKYYNGFTQAQVKPTDISPLLKLGVEKAPPIMTTAVVLDAKAWHGGVLPEGFVIGPSELQAMMSLQGLTARGILPGDAVYIRTGWGEHWNDPTFPYYNGGPGLSVQGAEWLAQRKPVVVALDNPFTDAVLGCELAGTCAPPYTTLPNLPFSVHHTNLTKYGIHQMQNMNLTEIANDNVNIACTIVTPLRIKGASGSPVRPIAIGKGQ